MDNDFPEGLQTVDKDAAEQRVTEPATNDEQIYQEQLAAEVPEDDAS